MASKIAYYLLVYPLSLLPLRVLYFFSDLIFILFVTLIPYRKKVINKNLKHSFTQLNQKELRKLRRRFYRHLGDLLIEGVKNLSITENELSKRFKVKNNTIMQELYLKKKSVILVSGHYNNWEWLITSQAFLFKHQAFGIGMPMSSKFWDKKVKERRERFGLVVLNANNYKTILNNSAQKFALLSLSDQSPGNSAKSYWLTFLNQPTPVLFGTEKIAHELDCAVVYFTINKLKRGYYEMDLQLVCEDPKELSWGEITEKHSFLLEKAIKNKPEFWLWSHNRWKRSVPDNLEELKKSQEKSFNEKYKNQC
jgi:KDO2-lipid IV(A) lauroyltransferase